MGRYGLKIGLGFQIADDILDVSASSEQLGKTAGKDVAAAKCTYPAVVGIEKARELERKLAHEAVAALEPFGDGAGILRRLAVVLSTATSRLHASDSHEKFGPRKKFCAPASPALSVLTRPTL